MQAESDPWADASAEDVDYYCLGCQESFSGLTEYKNHNCPNPAPGEAVR